MKLGNGEGSAVNTVEKKSMDELLVKPSLEDELYIENKAREIMASDDHEDTARLAVALMKQNYAQGQVLRHCFDKIHALEAKLICLKNPVKQPERPWWKFWTS